MILIISVPNKKDRLCLLKTVFLYLKLFVKTGIRLKDRNLYF